MKGILQFKYFGKLYIFLLLLLLSPSNTVKARKINTPHGIAGYRSKAGPQTPLTAWLSTLIICGLLFANVAMIQVNKDSDSY
ncbi:hypothetical protein A0256_12360 [Mucilaginibacter sp. PAMC 26640]|nr:hypothetical protein A0256_12360 [Mucilaginibacter sp. PAMC 26640]